MLSSESERFLCQRHDPPSGIFSSFVSLEGNRKRRERHTHSLTYTKRSSEIVMEGKRDTGFGTVLNNVNIVCHS